MDSAAIGVNVLQFLRERGMEEALTKAAPARTGVLTTDGGVIASRGTSCLRSSSCQTLSTLSMTFTLKTWTKSLSRQETALRWSKRTTISEMAGGRSVLEASSLLMRWLNYLLKQGRNLQGHIGLFPQSYTAPAPPVGSAAPDGSPLQNGKSVLHPLDEESETEAAAHAPEHSAATIHAPIPKSPAILQQNGDHNRSTGEFSSYSATTMSSTAQHRKIASGSDGEVMKATLTDVEQAIEQLGRSDHEVAEDSDRERSFSFASHGGETETETDYENSDVDIAAPGGAGGGEGYHIGARRKLAETARRALEEADKLNAITNSMPSGRRMMSPPINVEMSDESDDEDYAHHPESYKRTHPHIPEEDEEDAGLPAAEEKDNDTTVISDSAYATTVTSTPLVNSVNSDTPTDHTAVPSIRSEEALVKASNSATSNVVSASNSNRRSSTSDSKVSEPRRTSSPRSIGYVVVSSLDGVVRAVSPQPPSQEVPPPLNALAVEKAVEKKEKSPTEWTLDDVIEWLKSKGFDDDVQSKFIGVFLLSFLSR